MTVFGPPRLFDLRGMNLEQILDVSMRALDERFEEIITNVGDMIRDHGGTEEEAEFAREWQRHFLKEERAIVERKLRLALEHDCDGVELH
jgi:hypothetical protein